MKHVIRLLGLCIRLVWLLLSWGVALCCALLRLVYQTVLVIRDARRLKQRLGVPGAIACSHCGGPIPELAAQMCSCGFRYWGRVDGPCPECGGHTPWISACPHCDYTSTNPALLGKELP